MLPIYIPVCLYTGPTLIHTEDAGAHDMIKHKFELILEFRLYFFPKV